ncbi:Vesicle-trafficking protein SEC22a [Holothuria leucospilota]|uniref:Vesicle-trafficking protein SEC22a n=1 Tax=Holothuria leucospilota TaxID=206669 RepID=A0A9Q1BFY6_HOLLE|nr:Vesicle-trafficking protein SEC22a [Holothuria leucospilota]
MVVFALISRVSDGLPLSATTDHETSHRVLDSKKCAKMLSKKASSVPDRCSLHTGSHWLYLISSLGVSFITLCEESYPTVLAFCFLDELQREFICSYDAKKVKNVSRPYALIEFNIILQKIKQRYNNTRSLKPRTNLNDMSQEVKLRPPHRLSLSDVDEGRTYHQMDDSIISENYKSLPGNHNPPLGWIGKFTVGLCILWASYHFIRCGAIVSSGPVVLKEHFDEVSVSIAAFFGGFVSSVLQAYFVASIASFRIIKAFLTAMLITLCCSLLYMDGWMEGWLAYGHIASCWLAALVIMCRRRIETKLPNYTV